MSLFLETVGQDVYMGKRVKPPTGQLVVSGASQFSLQELHGDLTIKS